ncbi:MAG: hypothetical protein ABIQ53_16470 [Terracoccus sp.]
MTGDSHGPAPTDAVAEAHTTGDAPRFGLTAADAAVPGPPQPQPPTRSQPPLTGDVELDAAMVELARAQSRSFGERIDSGERVHRHLQGRLGDLGRA